MTEQDQEPQRMPEDADSRLGYPGRAIVGRAAANTDLTCWLMAGMVVFSANLLFVPPPSEKGKSPLTEYPLLLVGNLVAAMALGPLAGRLAVKHLKQADPNMWQIPGRIERHLPLPAEQAASRAFQVWVVLLPLAVILQHKYLPALAGARVASPWWKGLLTVLVLAFFQRALVARLGYELLRK